MYNTYHFEVYVTAFLLRPDAGIPASGRNISYVAT